ncbi:hypothetical protein PPSIR1_14030 [Plesiocystis pacifica SIR-1]|uniref:Uncharacterized protein n=1 Tax=Plesiocystis pacifica SIR-1 TaxID=391625 RepID=A6G8Z1_9BACT|nr:hypothetical protein [Plesiocystis pacifica]EDM77677.1 hypothetical protein PPSIR1_14030 [Plesiocystis pacifica SIR-1]
MIPCPDCKRHIHESDASCPFCGHSQKTTANRWVAFVGAMLMTTALGSSGCGREEPAGDEAGEGADTETETETETETSADSSTTADTSTETTTTADTEADTVDTTVEEESADEWDDGGGSFYAGPEDEWEDTSDWDWCDPFEQDCPEGEKCVPFISFSDTYDANTCVPILGDNESGAPCELFSPFEGTDDCDGNSFCWYADFEDSAGECRSFCTGQPSDPMCPVDESCLITNEGTVNLCLQHCDPLVASCPDGQACAWSGTDLVCMDAGETAVGDGCGGTGMCSPGQLCVENELLPVCEGSSCCTEFCKLGDPDATCTLEGTACEPFFEEGAAPEGLEEVGLCVIPQP